jgi:hypothetical protein
VQWRALIGFWQLRRVTVKDVNRRLPAAVMSVGASVAGLKPTATAPAGKDLIPFRPAVMRPLGASTRLDPN